jgi:hypothetical protein
VSVVSALVGALGALDRESKPCGHQVRRGGGFARLDFKN